MEDYLKYWGVEKPPFTLTPDPDMLYLSNQHAECLMRLKYAIFSQKGGALLVSDTAGNGKTSILSRLRKDLDLYYSGRSKVVFIDHPTVSPIEMINEIAHQLGSEFQTNEKIKALNYLRDRLFSLYNENIKVVVIVDEGQMLKERADLLGELRILLNFCVSDAFLLTFIFSGQKPLDLILREMPEFWQRLPVRFFLKNLDYNDTKALIQYRLEKVGAKKDIFTDDAFEGIYKYSEGCPRVICSVADLCLMLGYAKGVRKIGFVEVSNACRDMESSGDGFHYFAYLKSYDSEEKPQEATKIKKKLPSFVPSQKKGVAKHTEDDTTANIGENVICQSCTTSNPKGSKFCTSCNRPLFHKCPKCCSLTDTISDICPYCGSNMKNERAEIIREIRQKIINIVPIGDNDHIWCKANNIHTEDDETVVSIFPGGNFFSGGTFIEENNAKKIVRKGCDLVMTDRRIFIRINDLIVSTDIIRIDSCTLTSEGRMLNKRFKVSICFDGNLYKLGFSYTTGKSKLAAELVYNYIRSITLF